MQSLRPLGVYSCVLLAGSPTAVFGQAAATGRGGHSDPVYLIIRTQGELDALTSQRFTGALKARNVQVMTYRGLVAREGLKAMRRPAG
jgi:hypothetical protein